jgi:hypothetical protein
MLHRHTGLAISSKIDGISVSVRLDETERLGKPRKVIQVWMFKADMGDPRQLNLSWAV